MLQHETLIQLPSRIHSLRNSRRAIVYSLEDQSLTGELLMCVGRAGREARREFDQNIFHPSLNWCGGVPTLQPGDGDHGGGPVRRWAGAAGPAGQAVSVRLSLRG